MPYSDKQKIREYQKRYYLTNREKCLLYAKIYKKNNKDKKNPDDARRYLKRYRDRPEVRERRRKYYQNNKQSILRKIKEWQQKNPGRDRERKKKYRETHREQVRKTQRACYERNKDSRLVYGRQYYYQNRNYFQTKNHEQYHIVKAKILHIVGRGMVKCAYCGCDDIKLLEVNHINGDGRLDRERKGGSNLYCNIFSGRRAVHDLNIACKLCNWWHYIDRKYGPKLPYTIAWNAPKKTRKIKAIPVIPLDAFIPAA